jgi:hypothetical protein
MSSFDSWPLLLACFLLEWNLPQVYPSFLQRASDGQTFVCPVAIPVIGKIRKENKFRRVARKKSDAEKIIFRNIRSDSQPHLGTGLTARHSRRTIHHELRRRETDAEKSAKNKLALTNR